jgi:hypothetical protein
MELELKLIPDIDRIKESKQVVIKVFLNSSEITDLLDAEELQSCVEDYKSERGSDLIQVVTATEPLADYLEFSTEVTYETSGRYRSARNTCSRSSSSEHPELEILKVMWHKNDISDWLSKGQRLALTVKCYDSANERDYYDDDDDDERRNDREERRHEEETHSDVQSSSAQ